MKKYSFIGVVVVVVVVVVFFSCAILKEPYGKKMQIGPPLSN